jgi:hypothetical protein
LRRPGQRVPPSLTPSLPSYLPTYLPTYLQPSHKFGGRSLLPSLLITVAVLLTLLPHLPLLLGRPSPGRRVECVRLREGGREGGKKAKREGGEAKGKAALDP